jgi:hypothetical protein
VDLCKMLSGVFSTAPVVHRAKESIFSLTLLYPFRCAVKYRDIDICGYTHIHTKMFIYPDIEICGYTYIHAKLFMYPYLPIYRYMYVHTYIYIYIYIDIYTYIDIYVCMYRLLDRG